MAETAARRSEMYRLMNLDSDINVAEHREVLENDLAVSQIVDRARTLWTSIRDAGVWIGAPAPAYILEMGTEGRIRVSLEAAIWELSRAWRPEWERLNDELLDLAEAGDEMAVLDLLVCGQPLGCAANVPSRLYGGTALSCACAMGHTAVVQHLLSFGASVTLRAPARGPLHGAWLPLACATVHAQHAHDGDTRERYLATVRQLVASGASPEEAEQGILTPSLGTAANVVADATPLTVASADAARPPEQQRMQEILTLFKQVRRSRLWRRLRRLAPVVGRWRRALLLLFEEVHYRPYHEGAKRCRASFEGMAGGVLSANRAAA